MVDDERIPTLLADIERFAASARRVAERGHARFVDPHDDEQRRITCSLVMDLATASARLPAAFRDAHPDVNWNGVHAVRDFVAHDYVGTDAEILWQAMAVEFPRIAQALRS